MRVPLPAAVCSLTAVGLALLVAPSSAGDKAATHQLRHPAVVWKKGDVSTLSGRFGVEVVRCPSFGKEDPRTKRLESAAWTASVRADRVDTEGAISAGTAWFESGFVQAQGSAQADTTLGGCRVDFADGQWKNAGGLSEPSSDVGAWLSDAFLTRCLAGSRITWLGALDPGRAVAVGEEWDPDFEALARHLSQVWDMELSGDGATGTCKLDAVKRVKVGEEQRVVSLWALLTFPLRRAPQDAQGKRHPVDEGTQMNVTLQAHIGDAGRLPFREITISGRYDQRDARGEGSWSGRLTAWWGVKNEGSIPDPKR